MRAATHTDGALPVEKFAERVTATADEPAARLVYRQQFHWLRSRLTLYPDGSSPSSVFESAAHTARRLAEQSLPLAIAVVMHLYPLCVLQCVPLPLLSPARFKRALLLQAIKNRSLILANAGSERSLAADETLIATQTAQGLRINGTCEYMSLSSVADVVLFKAKLADGAGTALCAADLRAESVRIGSWKFAGNMRLSDTASVSFVDHPVPQGRYLLVQDAGLRCVSDYQRSWFHLFLAETYLARLERVRSTWALPCTAEYIVSLNEVAHLRQYSLRLLDDFDTDSNVGALTKSTSALKLRVSLMSQSTVAALRARRDLTVAQAQSLAADTSELGYIKLQPTADEKILRSLGVN